MTQEAALVDADLNHDDALPGVARAAAAFPAPKSDSLDQRFAQGDPGSFEELVAMHQAQVARLAHRLLGWRGGSAVEDVVQDVFLAAFTHRARFRQDASLSTWLAAMTVNRCRSHQRRWRLWWRWIGQQAAAVAASPTPPLEHGLSLGETAAQVRQAVQRLPLRDREVVVLRYFEGFGARQIAALTRQSTNAVEVRLHRARAKLAEALGPWVRQEQP